MLPLIFLVPLSPQLLVSLHWLFGYQSLEILYQAASLSWSGLFNMYDVKSYMPTWDKCHISFHRIEPWYWTDLPANAYQGRDIANWKVVLVINKDRWWWYCIRWNYCWQDWISSDSFNLNEFDLCIQLCLWNVLWKISDISTVHSVWRS